MPADLLSDEALAPTGPVAHRPPGRPDLRGVVTTVWTTTVSGPAAVVRVVPDAAADLVLAAGRLVVAGPDTRAVRERLPAGPVFGFQLAPDAVAHVLGAPASTCLNTRVDITDLWGQAGRVLADRLAVASDPATAARLVEDAIAARVPGLEHDPVPAAVRSAFASGRRVDPRDTGLGERQLRRRCVAAFGYPPTTLRRIARFQRFVAAVRSDPSADLAALAHGLGYSDQSHLTHEVREFSGLTPAAFRTLAGWSSRYQFVAT